MKAETLYYDHISAFKRQFYKDLLLPEHITGGKIFIKNITFEDGEVRDNYNFMGWALEKDNVKYLLPHTTKVKKDGKMVESPVVLSKTLPIIVQKKIEVAFNGNVYVLIKKFASAKINPDKKYEFKTMIDNLTALGHSNTKHQKLMAMIGVCSMYTRANFRVSTPPGFGKDSTVDILGNLVGKAGTITSPSYPKLEERSTVYHWLVINEVVSMKKTDWDTTQQYLLDAGAFKPTLTKRTKAHGTVGEEIPAENLSIGLFYNDVMNYPDHNKYFDYASLDAVKDRFPAIRFSGTFTEKFHDIKVTDVEEFAKKHTQTYKNFLYTFSYFKENLGKYLHGYKREGLIPMPERWLTNMERLLDIVDAYSETQEEFNGWILELNRCMIDYSEMIKFPNILKQFLFNQGLDEELIEKHKSLHKLIDKAKIKLGDKMSTFLDQLVKQDSYTNMNILLEHYNKEKDYANQNLSSY